MGVLSAAILGIIFQGNGFGDLLSAGYGGFTSNTGVEAVDSLLTKGGFSSMPFEMIDKRGGLRQRNLRSGDVRFRGQQASFIGFDIDVAREMARALGAKFVPVNTAWPRIIPALNLGRFDIIISGMSVTEERKKRIRTFSNG